VHAFLEKQIAEPFSYREIEATRGHPPRGYDYDDSEVQLGEGKAVYDRAVEALFAWQMFPPAWTRILTAETGQIHPGLNLVVQARASGLWWLNACRVVYLVDEQNPVRRRGFAYGTLPAHLEQGEELFTIEQWADGTVWYRVQAFSRPRCWAARAGKPLVRHWQRKFVRDSQATILQAVRTPE